MKKLLLILVLLFSLSIYSQDTNDNFIYCEIVGVQKYTSNKMVITIDYGDGKDLETRQESSDYNPMLKILNEMSNDGWLLFQSYPVTTGNNITAYHWILRKVSTE